MVPVSWIPHGIEGIENRRHTVDGSEIWQSPVEMVKIPAFTEFHTRQVVVWDVFHQQQKIPVHLVHCTVEESQESHLTISGWGTQHQIMMSGQPTPLNLQLWPFFGGGNTKWGFHKPAKIRPYAISGVGRLGWGGWGRLTSHHINFTRHWLIRNNYFKPRCDASKSSFPKDSPGTVSCIFPLYVFVFGKRAPKTMVV